MENIFHENSKQKREEVVIFKRDTMDFKSKTITRDRQGHFIKGSIHQDDIAIISLHAPNIRSSKCQYFTFNTRQEIQTETEDLNNPIDQMNPTYIQQNIPPNNSRMHILCQGSTDFCQEQITGQSTKEISTNLRLRLCQIYFLMTM